MDASSRRGVPTMGMSPWYMILKFRRINYLFSSYFHSKLFRESSVSGAPLDWRSHRAPSSTVMFSWYKVWVLGTMKLTGEELPDWQDWAKAIRNWNLEIRRQEHQEWHNWAREPGVTWLGMTSRSDKTGYRSDSTRKEHQEWHGWARAPGVTWLGKNLRSDMTGAQSH